MLEVVFSDSTKGAMKMAKNYNKENMIGGAIGYIGKKPSKKNWKSSLKANLSEEVPGMSSALDLTWI